eukprot:Nitzschia sp. Nitz4//scaffold8_size234185//232841//234078//NITZ4_001308-RA/size234185-augustus-gene-0.283-mRNA-1//-1//CDS//3329559959//1881//frame0
MSFVPPVAREKMKARRRRKQREQRQLIGAITVVGLFVMFLVTDQLHRFQDITSTEKTSKSVLDLPMQSRLRGGDAAKAWISKESQPFNDKELATRARNLVMVAGHSVTISGHLEDAGQDESDWFLLDYQKGQGLPQAIRAHISAGIETAHRDPESLLIFSGGETRAVTGPLTEGASYFHAADAMHLWPSAGTVRARTTTEEFATDSFENLMFSICRFQEVTGRYPDKITVVSFTFKERRFKTLHAPALQWPSEKFSYVGVDPPASTGFNLQRSIVGERENAAAPFEQDPYGCHSEVLQKKRRERNPFHRTPPYTISCPDLSELLHYCGPDPFPVHKLPWGS